jgi:serine/threonine-protein kinase
MEYVDGEDLGSLLRRIGHIPKTKAIEIARQLCAGLAAAHETGVLHRDLKPANVMIDGRGRARITDFGLAALAEDIAGDDVRSGTPAYMAPEQIEGREVTVRSDLYSLGLVLYELFTGKPAFHAASLEERRRLQTQTTPSSPSTLVEGFDPAVERIILRCLEARSGAPAVVGAVGRGGAPRWRSDRGRSRRGRDAVAADGRRGGGFGRGARDGSPGPRSRSSSRPSAGASRWPPSASSRPWSRSRSRRRFLTGHAREILALAGRTQRPVDTVATFHSDEAYLEALLRTPAGRGERWGRLRTTPPAAIHFSYRESPRPLVPLMAAATGNEMIDPPVDVPGMARVELDTEGRLVSLLVVPPERTAAVAAGEEGRDPDWDPLLRATGVDPQTIARAEPAWAPPVFADRRAAWSAVWPERRDVPLRIEAASAGGNPVFLRVVEPWTRPAEVPPPEGGLRRAAQLAEPLAFMTAIVIAAIVALRNVRRGRGDRRGALRFALYLGALRMLWYLGAHHVASGREADIFIAISRTRCSASAWPTSSTLRSSPTRAGSGRGCWSPGCACWRDGSAIRSWGRDLAVGCAAGALVVLVARASSIVAETLGGTRACLIRASGPGRRSAALSRRSWAWWRSTRASCWRS